MQWIKHFRKPPHPAPLRSLKDLTHAVQTPGDNPVTIDKQTLTLLLEAVEIVRINSCCDSRSKRLLEDLMK